MLTAIPADFDACSYGSACPRKLSAREDDTEAIVAARMKVHHARTGSVL
jgi:hypothetical protein